MNDCNCPPAPQAMTPAPSGNTQTQTTLFGSRRSKNGQPVTTALAVSPGGALLVHPETSGFTGGWDVQVGDIPFFDEGSLLYVIRNGAMITPIGGGLKDIKPK